MSRYWLSAGLIAAVGFGCSATAAPTGTTGPTPVQIVSVVPLTKPVDPERLAFGREIAQAFWPDGTVQKMMSSMADLKAGMMNQMMNASPKTLGAPGKDDGKTLGQLAREKDPNFEKRFAITNRIMMDEIGKVMTDYEPQMRESMAKLYARRFNKTELSDLATFLRTPSGKSYASQVMTMMTDPEFQEAMSGMMPKLMRAMPRIMDRIKKETASLPPPKSDKDSKPSALPST